MKYKLVLDIMNGSIKEIGEVEKQGFIRGYKRMLKDGFYLTISKETKQWKASNKFVEKHAKQVVKQDAFLKNIFIKI